MSFLRRLDNGALHQVNSFARHTGWLNRPMLDFAKYGVVLFALLLMAGLVVARARPARVLAAAGWAPLATLLAVAVNQPIGRLVAEARPYANHRDLLVLASRTSDFSFPSDHAVMAGAVAAGLLLVRRRLGLIAVAAAVLMAFARVYIAAHYPLDVIAGLVLGAAVTLSCWLVVRAPLTAFTGWLRNTRPLRGAFGST
jgi:undecaprenyl-diphosphatase